MSSRERTTVDPVRINRILRHYPELESIANILKEVSENGSFPINSCFEFEKMLGGEHATVTFAGQSFSVGLLRHAIPAYYFPIASEDDLIAKIADLQVRRPSHTLTFDPYANLTIELPRKEEYGGPVEKLPKGVSRPPKIPLKNLHRIAVENADKESHARDRQARATLRTHLEPMLEDPS